MKPPTSVTSVLALAIAAAATVPAVASAVLPPQTAAFVAQPIAAADGPAAVSIGNGTTAWSIRDHPFKTNAPGTTVWTLRAGQPAIAARLASVSARRIEAGTDASGAPVAILSGFPRRDAPTPFHIMRLATGEVARLKFGAHRGRVEDVAVDAGRILYTTSIGSDTPHARSTLWTARLNGGTIANARLLRRSARGVTFETVRADRSRIAVTGFRNLPPRPDGSAASLPLYAGTANGVWRKVGTGSGSAGGVFSVEAAGFSPNRRSVIVTTSGPDNFSVKRVWLRSGRERSLAPQNPDPTGPLEIQSAYDPSANRLLLSSIASASGYLVGWSNPLD